MAICIPGPLTSDVRGSIGNVTFSRNFAGLVAKARSNPSQPASGARDQAQANLTAVSQAWSGRLSSSQRDAWRTYGSRFPRPNRWGNPVIDSGYLAYVRYGCALKMINAAWWQNTAPTVGMLPAPPFTLVADQFNGYLEVTLTLDPSVYFTTNFYLMVSAGKTTNAGVAYYSTPWQFLHASEWDGEWWDPEILEMEFPVWCGVKDRLWVRAYMLNRLKRQMSVPFQNSCIVTYAPKKKSTPPSGPPALEPGNLSADIVD